MRTRLVFSACLLVACSNAGTLVKEVSLADGRGSDLASGADLAQTDAEWPDLATDSLWEVGGLDLVSADAPTVDSSGPQCAPGEGCFLDKCEENGDCQSGWCVDHMGDAVCSMGCTEECPSGWSCQQVAGTAPDVVYVCVSDFANLCKPCASGDNCKSVGGADDVCVDYGAEGAFCGGSCDADEDCPWGFSCTQTETVDGVATTQCVADAGICPCTGKAIELSLWTPCVNANEFGACAGKRVCTHDGLSQCDALVPAAEVCNGMDDDCDGEFDEPHNVEGTYVGLCNDDNECTDDACLGESGCQHTQLSQGECKDGDSCTVGDHCLAGECVGSPIQCDDSNPCTDDSCDGLGGCSFEHNNSDCDDGDPCTVADECNLGLCGGVAIACDCLTDADCGPLEDGDKCNGTLTCNTEKVPYQCQVNPETIVTCPGPQGDQTACLAAACDPATGVCSVVPANDGFACDDGDACTLGELCLDGACQGGGAALCNDQNPCTDDSCDGDLGCLHSDNNDPCNDNNVCTLDDQCAAGDCVGGGLMVCDDENSCTEDLCDPAKGCLHVAQEGACDDGNACTTGDHCDKGKCLIGGILSCDDGNVCTQDSCDPGQGCIHLLSDAPCDDGDVCTTGDHCSLGGCVGSGTLVCNDGNGCTLDSCDKTVGCLFEPQAGDCDDGNACTLNDQCTNGQCKGGPALGCNDDNVCTTDSCDPQQGCVHSLNQAPCDDSDVCTTGDHCHLGECISAGTLTCDDANLCTDDSCQPESGCSFVPNSNACDDGNACTENDACSAGQCKPGKSADCDDENICTDDYCDFQVGCLNVNNKAPCDDGDKCTANEVCNEGTCGGGVPVLCNDGNICTDDSCAPEVGCLYTNNALPCDDGLACTNADLCANGACQSGEATPCDDANACTEDSCAEPGGCASVPVPNGTPCGEGKNCQAGVCETICQATSLTFSYTGGAQVLAIPACATKVVLEAWGAEGGTNGADSSKGKGGYARGEASNLAGKTLTIHVGGKGGNNGSTAVAGWNGGGGHHGGNSTNGGGGASDVRVDGAALGNRILVAGGGGGSAWCYSSTGVGGDGGNATGENGGYNSNATNAYGRGGTQSGGGQGGSFSGTAPSGALGTGGNAYNDNAGCGGAGAGGGGYYGGGGGAHGGGGGGGSSYVGTLQNTDMQRGTRSGHGQVKVSWE